MKKNKPKLQAIRYNGFDDSEVLYVAANVKDRPVFKTLEKAKPYVIYRTLKGILLTKVLVGTKPNLFISIPDSDTTTAALVRVIL